MRRVFLALACITPLTAACASKHKDSPRMITTSQANRGSLTGAMAAPLRDANVIRTLIPQVLLDAMVDPYARPPRADCLTLAELVRPLNETLGDDLDIVPIKEDEELIDRGKGWAGDAALGAVASAASDMIPMRGWVRKLSGAEKHDSLVQSAAAAGAVRRAYLKGLGEARGCDPPSTPDHTRTWLPKAPERKGPRFPIRMPGSGPAPTAATPATAPTSPAVPQPAPLAVPPAASPAPLAVPPASPVPRF